MMSILWILVLLFHIWISLAQSTPSFQTSFVSMRDGVKLAVDYFIDLKTERFPVILELTPYGRGPKGVNYRYEAPFWYENGYLFVIGDCRGTGDSDGEMSFFSHEGEDGYDLINWIANQSWSNGRVGMRGSSYTGTNQWFIAKEQSPLSIMYYTKCDNSSTIARYSISQWCICSRLGDQLDKQQSEYSQVTSE